MADPPCPSRNLKRPHVQHGADCKLSKPLLNYRVDATRATDHFLIDASSMPGNESGGRNERKYELLA